MELISIHNTVKYPRQPMATVGNHMGMHEILLDTFDNLNTQIILLNVFSNGHEAATKDGDHFTVFGFANIKYQILSNTTKYYMGTSL